MYQEVSSASDPNAALQNLSRSNKDVANALDAVRRNGGDGQAAFMQEARNRGLNDAQIANVLNTAKSMFAG